MSDLLAQLTEHRTCVHCGASFIPRSGSGGSVQRFCCTDCRLSFHKERLRSQRIGSYAGQLPQPATQEPPTLLEQAERLIAKLTLDERRRLIERLMAGLPPESPDTEPTLLLEPTGAAARSKNESDGLAELAEKKNASMGASGAEKQHPSVVRLCALPLREQP
jgi:hypothetical protein